MKGSHLNDDGDWFLTTRRPPTWAGSHGRFERAGKEDQGLLQPDGGQISDTDATVTPPATDPCQRQGKLTAIKVRLSQNR
jgi:hypothetical protein